MVASPIYLDHNATSPLRPEALEAMQPWLANPANANSRHHFGRQARLAVERTREQVAALIKVPAAELIFTHSASQALELAVRHVGKYRKTHHNHTLFSAVGHPAARYALELLPELPARAMAVDKNGTQLDLPTNHSALVATVPLANAETGHISDVPAIAGALAQQQTSLVCDATQALGRMALDAPALGAQYIAFGAHKTGGPQGVGALYIKNGRQLRTFERVAGTPNTAAVAGFGAVCALLAEQQQAEQQQLQQLRDTLETTLLQAVDGTFAALAHQPRLPNTTMICFPGLSGAMIVEALAQQVACSTGSACSSGSQSGSKVLEAMGFSKAEAHAAVRFSVGYCTTVKDVKLASERIIAVVKRLADARIS